VKGIAFIIRGKKENFVFGGLQICLVKVDRMKEYWRVKRVVREVSSRGKKLGILAE
jgi:hypothetical protein